MTRSLRTAAALLAVGSATLVPGIAQAASQARASTRAGEGRASSSAPAPPSARSNGMAPALWMTETWRAAAMLDRAPTGRS